MREMPEVAAVARQMNETVRGRKIVYAEANHTPHGFAFYRGDAAAYGDFLRGREIGETHAHGGILEMHVGDARLVLSDGANLVYHPPGAAEEDKHQLLARLDDGSHMMLRISMYGMIWLYENGAYDNEYYLTALKKPGVYAGAFTYEYFKGLKGEIAPEKCTVKAFLATEQRVPGLGNGVLQDILFRARLSPKRKMKDVTETEFRALYDSAVETLVSMRDLCGRDTERDFFGRDGGYRTVLSKKTVSQPCPACGAAIVKQNYMGGSVYFCPVCQR